MLRNTLAGSKKVVSMSRNTTVVLMPRYSDLVCGLDLAAFLLGEGRRMEEVGEEAGKEDM